MYIIRLDDASDRMHIENWNRIELILDENNIKPLVGIIPVNNDPTLQIFEKSEQFWEKARDWQNKGWRIALHGYEHVYSTNCAGINPVHERSEFAGLPLEVQQQKLRSGIRILKDNGINPTVFFAPSHTFDSNTLEALRLETDIRIISDTAAFDVYSENGFTFIPQQSGSVRSLPFAVTTICLHPNFMSEDEFLKTQDFIVRNKEKFIDPNSITETTRKKSLIDKAVNKMYFFKRKLHK